MLWRVIYAEGGVIVALVAVVWHHIMEDKRLRRDVYRLKLRLGMNGEEA